MVNRSGREFSSKKKSRSTFTYTPRDPDAVKARAERTGGKFDSIYKSGFDVWRPKVGDNLIRILPPTWEDHDHYGFDVWVHAYIGADNSTYLCLQKMKGKPCAICDAAKEAKSGGEEDEAKALGNKQLIVSWILDRDADSTIPLVYGMSWTMDRDIAALCHNKRTGKILLIDHPDDGYDITIKRSGQGLKTKYFGMAVDRESSTICDGADEQEKVLDFVQENPIPSILHYFDNEYLGKVLDGTTAASSKDKDFDEDEDKPKRGRERDREEDDDSEKPKRGRRDEPEDEEDKPRRGRSSRDEEETSDDHDHEADEAEEDKKSRSRDRNEPEDEEKPKRRGREEEEAEKPRRGRSRGDEEEDDRSVKRRSREDDEDDKSSRSERVRSGPSKDRQ